MNMDSHSNTSVVIVTPHTFTSVSITIIILQVIGIIFNAAFILITRKGDAKITDRTLLLASGTQIGQGLVTFAKFTFVLACKDNETALQWYFIFGEYFFNQFIYKLNIIWYCSCLCLP